MEVAECEDAIASSSNSTDPNILQAMERITEDIRHQITSIFFPIIYIIEMLLYMLDRLCILRCLFVFKIKMVVKLEIQVAYKSKIF